AGALDWPGWSRSGRDEDAALEALLAYGPRYERAIQPAQLGFHSPQDVNALVVSERLEGNSTTDFGAPAIAPAIDADPVDPSELHRFQALLQACWQAFEAAVEQAKGKELRKGPRGGGRDLDKIVAHVLGAESAYLSRLGWKFKLNEETAADEELNRIQEEISKALLRSPFRLAHPRSRLGDRRPPHLNRSPFHPPLKSVSTAGQAQCSQPKIACR
ncbi:MAG: hypothetical protein P8074_27815, partial [Anaerolineales bacterium]